MWTLCLARPIISSISTFPRACALGALIGLGSSLLPAFAADTAASAPSSQIQARYEQERARCLNGSSNQDRATCLKEAGAARDEAMHSRLDEKGANYKADAMARCQALTGDEAKDCRARVKGAASTSSSGSVQSGGIVRETRTPTGAAPTASAAY